MQYSAYLTEYILVIGRLLPFFASSGQGPLQRLPGIIRIVILLGFSLAVSFIIKQERTMPKIELIYIFINEFLIGLALFFVIQLAFISLAFWGRVLDMQVGFGAAGVLDPNTKTAEPLLGSFYYIAALALFYIFGFHRELMSGVVYSYEALPIGNSFYTLDFEKLIPMISTVFSAALILFAPVIILMWCLDLFVGFLSRTMPQMNIYFVMLPLKIFTGIYLLSVFLVQSKPAFKQLFELTLSLWQKLLR